MQFPLVSAKVYASLRHHKERTLSWWLETVWVGVSHSLRLSQLHYALSSVEFNDNLDAHILQHDV